MVMENYYSHEKYRELWLKINHLHLSYLEMEESNEKLQHRSKLEDCIAEFLFMAHHRDKFVNNETEDVLYRSAAFKKDFSGYKATTGWNALQIYASNLLTQPWRKEYRQIKTYCGFYKHQIEANLLGAETLFQAMGYKHVGNGILALDGPVCPDRASNMSRDCLVAYVECQILKHIWEEISSAFNVTWLDILENRVEFPGSIDQCVKNISYKYNAKRFQPPMRSASRVEQFEGRQSNPARHGSLPNSIVHVPNNHSYAAALSVHNHATLPQPLVGAPVPCCLPHTNGCANIYSYGYGTYAPQLPIVNQPVPAVNGYYFANGPSVMQPPYQVPTGQLIEFDKRNGHDLVDGGPSSRSRRSRLDSNGTLESDGAIRGEDVPKNGIASGQEDKQASVEEDWDYVFRNLEQHGYSKDLGERGDVLGLTASDKQRKYLKEQAPRQRVRTTNLDEALNSLTVSDRPLKMTEALEHMEKKPIERNLPPAKERRHSQGSSYENVTSNDASKHVTSHTNIQPNYSSSNAALPPKLKVPKESVEVSQLNLVPVDGRKEKEPEKVSSSKWQCKSCTYLNDFTKDICEICSKSRYIGQEQPMEIGGPECSKCTLVNPKNAKICQACNNSLKNSPTYI